MRRIIPFIVAMQLFVSVCAFPYNYSLAEASVSVPGLLTITFNYEKQPGLASNQFAVWIEDMDGNLVKTLYTTSFTANGGYRIRPDILPIWVTKSDAVSMEASEIDAITGSTPEAGDLSFTWDLTDSHGNAVVLGTYQFLVEGSLRWYNRVVFSGIIDTEGSATVVQGIAEYFYDRGAAGWPALAKDAPEHDMIGVVEAIWQPSTGG